MERRKPTYGSAVRMAKLISILARAWRPVSVEQIAEELEISPRTAQRYRKALNDNLLAADEGEFLRVIKEGGKERWFLVDQEEILSATSSRIISVYVAKVLLKFLEGTVIDESLKEIWTTFTGKLPPSRKVALELYDRKIMHTGFGRKSYEKQDDVLAKLLKGLVQQKKLQIHHTSYQTSKDKYHVIHPYTLLLHRDTLYLIAHAEGYGQVRTFSLDKIREVVVLDEGFKYPGIYDPEKVIDGSFGIFEKPGAKPFKAVISFKEPLFEYLTTRSWHPTQKFSKLKNGSFTMEVHLTNTKEFIPWILQFGSEATVLKPKSLQEAVKKELLLACNNY